MRKSSTLLLALLLTASIPFASHAQGVTLGAHGGFDSDASEVLIGGSVGFTLPGIPLSLTPGFDFYPSITGISLFIVDFDANYAFPSTRINPYVGVGLFMRHTSIDLGTLGSFSGNDVGFNLNGGLDFAMGGPLAPFAEAKLRVTNNTTIAIRGGLKFKLGR